MFEPDAGGSTQAEYCDGGRLRARPWPTRSCTAGPVGPAGPAGAPGPQGIAGPQGQQGWAPEPVAPVAPARSMAPWTAPSAPRAAAPAPSAMLLNPVQLWATVFHNVFSLQRKTLTNLVGLVGARNTQNR